MSEMVAVIRWGSVSTLVWLEPLRDGREASELEALSMGMVISDCLDYMDMY